MRKRTCAKPSSCALMNRFCISLWQAFSWPRQNATKHAWIFARVSTWTPICLTFRISSTTAVNLERTERCAAKMRPRRPQTSNRPVPPPYPVPNNQAAERCGHADQLILSRESGGRAPRCSFRYNIYSELQPQIAELAAAGIRPVLAAVLVGHNPASQVYVKSKIAACEKLGLRSWLFTPAESVSTAELLQLIGDLNRREDVDGI